MSMLALTESLKTGEPATSLASRLAVRNGVEDAKNLCLDLGLNWSRIIVGDRTELISLGRLSGIDVRELIQFSPIVAGRANYLVNGQVVNKYCFSRTRIRVCPCCICDDVKNEGLVGAARRSWWQLKSLRTCFDHHVPLIDLTTLSRYPEVYDFSVQIAQNLALIVDAAENSVRREPTLFERYIVDRFLGTRQNGYLDQLELHVATRLCEVLGFSLKFGSDRNLRDADSDALMYAGEAGLEALVNGELGFRAALNQLQSRGDDKTLAHRRDLGALFHWLAPRTNSSEHQSIVELVSGFVFDNYTIPTGRSVLGRKAPDQGHYSIESASREFAVNQARLRSLLIEKGLLARDGQTMRLTASMKAHDARKYCDEVRDLVTRRKAYQILGVSAATFNDLLRLKVIQRKRWQYRAAEDFSRRELEEFVNHIFASAKLYKNCPADLVDLYSASKFHCTISSVVSRVLDGKLKRLGRLASQPGLRALLVDPEELSGSVAAYGNLGFARAELAKLLGVKSKTISYLVDEELLSSGTNSSEASGRDVEMISQRSVEYFLSHFVSLTCLARQLNRSTATLGSELAEYGVAPISSLRGLDAIYSRGDLEPLSLPK